MLVAALALAGSSTTPQCDADDWEAAAARVRAVAARAFDGYAEHAWGRDELRPVTNRSRDNWGGLAVTMIDSLDTLLLMGLTEQYKRARDWLVDNLPARLGAAVDVPFFEVVIRCLGGLLGAHTLSGDAALLDLAEQLGDKLLRAFDSPSGLPFCTVNLAHGNASCPPSDFGYSIPLAELGSVQLEFGALAVLLDRREIAVAADGALRTLRRLPSLDGLYPSRLRPHSGGPAAKDVGFGSGVRRRHPNCRAACQHAAPGLVSLPASTPPSTLSLSAHPHPHLYPKPYPSPSHPKLSLARSSQPHPTPEALPLRQADSFYETLLKRWLQTGGTQPWLLAMHRESLRGLRSLLRRSHPAGRLFVARKVVPPPRTLAPARDTCTCTRPGHKQPASPPASPPAASRPPRAGLCAARRAAREVAASLRAELRAPLLLRARMARSGCSLRRRGDECLRGVALRAPHNPSLKPSPGPSPISSPKPNSSLTPHPPQLQPLHLVSGVEHCARAARHLPVSLRRLGHRAGP